MNDADFGDAHDHDHAKKDEDFFKKFSSFLKPLGSTGAKAAKSTGEMAKCYVGFLLKLCVTFLIGTVLLLLLLVLPPLKDREWLVRTGEGLMVPCARAFLFKHLPLQSWLDYCQKFGTPGIRGVTSAARDSAEWNTFAAAMQTFLSDLAVVTNSSESIEVIDLKGHGEAPFAALVERMDRMMAAIWRGADLSTISRDKGYGASLQEAESQLLETDDAKAISETLNNTVDQWVIKYLFGEGAVPKAYIRIVVPAKESTAQDLAIDEFFIRQGVKLDLAKTLERYGRTEAEPGERGIGIEGTPNGQRATSGKRQLNDQYL